MAEPKVRFKRDDGSTYPAWINGRFGDLIEVYDEKVTSDCTLPVLTSSKTDGIQYQSDHFGREQLHDITGYNVIPRGYCTYRNRSDGTDFTFNINHLCDRGIVSKFYPVFHATDRCNLFFLMTLMNNEPKTVRKIAMTAKGTGQKVLSFLDLQKIEINIPCLEEQQKIADFLSSVDEVITASEAEVQNLETQKKAVMKMIFSQDVRFKKDDGTDFPEWEENALSERTSNFRSGKNIKADRIREEGTYPVIGGNGVRGYTDTYNHEGIYAVVGRQGALCGNVNLIDGKNYLTEHAVAVRGDDRTDTVFLSFLLVNMNLRKHSGQSAQPGLAVSEIIKLTAFFPCLEEQRLIANFLSDFDEAIAAAKKELELWKELKKGLLQQMFV